MAEQASKSVDEVIPRTWNAIQATPDEQSIERCECHELFRLWKAPDDTLSRSSSLQINLHVKGTSGNEKRPTRNEVGQRSRDNSRHVRSLPELQARNYRYQRADSCRSPQPAQLFHPTSLTPFFSRPRVPSQAVTPTWRFLPRRPSTRYVSSKLLAFLSIRADPFFSS